MRESEKKTFREKNIEPIFRKVNEGDEIKQTLSLFLKKVKGGDEKNKQKNIAGKLLFISGN